MKLQIQKTFRLARPEAWLHPWSFIMDEEVNTDNEYLINRLLELKAAKIVAKTSVSEEKRIKKQQEVDANKMMYEHKNKMFAEHENKNKEPKKRGRPKIKKDD